MADAVVVFGAATSSERFDRTTLSLDSSADSFIAAVADLGKPVGVMMQVPGAVLTPWRDRVSAIATMFLGGEGTATAWASALFGVLSPSGKLPVMFPASEQDAIQPGFGAEVNFSEGLFTSY